MNRRKEPPKSFAGQRRGMVEALADRGIKDLRVLESMSRVPRHLFVHESLQHRAYGESPLPIGEGQTISQPYTVASMTEALNVREEQKILEIGTGSGYQTALLADLGARVFTIERVKPLGRKAKKLVESLNYIKVVYKLFDGTYGWPAMAPFDGILVTASTPEIPNSLINQLEENGRLVAPVGGPDQQKIVIVEKKSGQIVRRELAGCNFVPLIGKYAWAEEEEKNLDPA